MLFSRFAFQLDCFEHIRRNILTKDKTADADMLLPSQPYPKRFATFFISFWGKLVIV